MPSYNPYYPMAYAPSQQGYYQNPYAQQNTPTLQTNGIIWVSGDADADAYPIAPNNAVTLWHRTMPIVYFKQADASGKPSMKVCELVERKPAPVSSAEDRSANFATKDEIRSLESTIQKMKDELKAIRKEVGQRNRRRHVWRRLRRV